MAYCVAGTPSTNNPDYCQTGRELDGQCVYAKCDLLDEPDATPTDEGYVVEENGILMLKPNKGRGGLTGLEVAKKKLRSMFSAGSADPGSYSPLTIALIVAVLIGVFFYFKSRDIF
ncbi:MAG: hypothetical protein GY881_02965 [Gammaproteobacteria bacterium]|nr:hypothetical protein [Gammaproteobacteria bacterium]